MSRPLDVNANENTFGLLVVKDIAGEAGEGQTGQSVDSSPQSVTNSGHRGGPANVIGPSNVIVPAKCQDIVFQTVSVGRTARSGHPALRGYTTVAGLPPPTPHSSETTHSAQTGHFQTGEYSYRQYMFCMGCELIEFQWYNVRFFTKTI